MSAHAVAADRAAEMVPGPLSIEDARAISLELMRRAGAPDALVTEGRCEGCKWGGIMWMQGGPMQFECLNPRLSGPFPAQVRNMPDAGCPRWEARP